MKTKTYIVDLLNFNLTKEKENFCSTYKYIGMNVKVPGELHKLVKVLSLILCHPIECGQSY